MTIPVPLYLRDHRFEDRTVMPAVEAMQILAGAVQQVFPAIDIHVIKDASFDKFLYIKPEVAELAVINDLTCYDNGDVVARLTMRVQSGKSTISRIKEHAVICFPGKGQRAGQGPGVNRSPASGVDFAVSPRAVYQELVPFGPAYHTITRGLHVSISGAIAEIHAPAADGLGALPLVLGSPFPLDAAFHAACVWGQRFHGIVAFPVGFSRREIVRPTQTGETYRGLVIPLGTDENGGLIFNLEIETLNGAVCEIIHGVRMRDVSAGRIKPPGWIRSGLKDQVRSVHN